MSVASRTNNKLIVHEKMGRKKTKGSRRVRRVCRVAVMSGAHSHLGERAGVGDPREERRHEKDGGEGAHLGTGMQWTRRFVKRREREAFVFL